MLIALINKLWEDIDMIIINDKIKMGLARYPTIKQKEFLPCIVFIYILAFILSKIINFEFLK